MPLWLINRFLTNPVTKENLTYFKLVIHHLWTLPKRQLFFSLLKRLGNFLPLPGCTIIKVKSFGKPRLTYKVYKKVFSSPIVMLIYWKKILHFRTEAACPALYMDFLIDGQISSFCPDQHEGKILTLIMLHKLTQSL